MPEAENVKGLVEALVGSKDALSYLWMSYADPMTCPLEPRRGQEMPRDYDDWRDSEAIALMLNSRRW